MSWHLGWCPWNDPVSAAQETTERMLAREEMEWNTKRYIVSNSFDDSTAFKAVKNGKISGEGAQPQVTSGES
jgi:hypothetical protein